MKSLNRLAHTLSIRLSVLEELSDNTKHLYRVEPTETGSKIRTISKPRAKLKQTQKRIYKCLLRPLDLPEEVQGCVAGRSPLTNVSLHLRQGCLIRIDIRDFFPSVTPTHVFKAWRHQVGCSPPVANLLTKLTTFKFSLPQGAPTSPALANLVLVPADREIRHLVNRTGNRFTRYVDDLALSGNEPERLVADVIQILQRHGFGIGRDKLHFMYRNHPQELTGYGANGVKPSVGKRKRARIRAAIHQLQELQAGTAEHKQAVSSIKGRLQHLRRTNPGSAQRLEDKLASRLVDG